MKQELESLIRRMRTGGICYSEAVSEFKKSFVLEVMIVHRGNQCKAAKELGMHRNTLGRTLEELGIDLGEVRMSLKRPSRSIRRQQFKQEQAG